MKLTEQGALTLWRWQREGLVRTQKETDRARRTNHLETAEGGTSQDTERNRPSEGHEYSQTGKCRGKAKSVYRMCGSNKMVIIEITVWNVG